MWLKVLPPQRELVTACLVNQTVVNGAAQRLVLASKEGALFSCQLRPSEGVAQQLGLPITPYLWLACPCPMTNGLVNAALDNTRQANLADTLMRGKFYWFTR